MKENIKNICDKTVYNYRIAKEELRYDGDYINHLAAIIYGINEEDIPVKKIKEIRSEFKHETSRISCFRGDILYIISILIALEENPEYIMENLLETYEKLMELEFRESQYLVIASYVMTKYVNKEYRYQKLIKMRGIYETIRKNYSNVTNHEDYLECALLAINGVDSDFIINYMGDTFENYNGMKNLSKNSIQALSMTLMLNGNEGTFDGIKNLFNKLEEENIKIVRQFLPLLGIVYRDNNPNEYIGKIKEIVNYLCEEEYEYEFYMDKGFRFFIALMLLESNKKSKEKRYMYELFSKGVYSLIVSKNQGIFDEVLA